MNLLRRTSVIALFLIARCCTSYDDRSPEELEREADAKSQEALTEREDADLALEMADDFREEAKNLRSRAEEKDTEAAREMRRRAEKLEQSAELAPMHVEWRRQRAQNLSQEAQALRRRAEKLRDYKKALLLCSGGAIYPIGWDNKELKQSCGNSSAVYKLGTCQLSWSVYLLGSAVTLLLLCFVLSFYSARETTAHPSFRMSPYPDGIASVT